MFPCRLLSFHSPVLERAGGGDRHCSNITMKAELTSEQMVQRQRAQLTEAFNAQLAELEQRLHVKEAEWRDSEAKLHEQYRSELEARVRHSAALPSVSSLFI
jgi:hypothetical protein